MRRGWLTQWTSWPTGNPGADASGVETLPVWRDASALPYGLPAVGLSEQAMTEALRAAADALGVELTEVTPHTLGETGSGLEHLDLPEGVGPDSVYSVEAAAENGWHLSISGDGTLTVSFKGAAGSEDSLPLPEGFAAPRARHDGRRRPRADGRAGRTVRRAAGHGTAGGRELCGRL